MMASTVVPYLAAIANRLSPALTVWTTWGVDVGRGVGEGVDVGIGVGEGVDVGTGVGVGVDVGMGVLVAVGVGVVVKVRAMFIANSRRPGLHNINSAEPTMRTIRTMARGMATIRAGGGRRLASCAPHIRHVLALLATRAPQTGQCLSAFVGPASPMAPPLLFACKAMLKHC